MLTIERIQRLEETGIVRCGFTTGDGKWAYAEDEYNYVSLAEAFGTSADRIVRVRQKHTARILKVSEAQAGEGAVRPGDDVLRDGMITNIPGIVLALVTADCVPVFLVDSVKKAIGAVHSGWKGTALGIAPTAVRMMHEEYNSDPKDIIVTLGAHVCKNCYEVGEELKEEFNPIFSDGEIEQFFLPKTRSIDDEQKYLLDLQRAISISLIKNGVKPENISDISRCTYEDSALFSWRRDHRLHQSILSAIELIE